MHEVDPADDPLLLAPSSKAPVRFRVGIGAGILLLLTALVVAVAVTMFTPRGSTETIEPILGATPTLDSDAGSAGASDSRAPDGSLFVHIFGAVRNPGLFELSEGARVIDAVSAAGGFAEDAEPRTVNLARLIADGEQIAVLRVGEAPPSGTAGAAIAAPNAGGPIAGSGKVNINTATAAELTSLPQVGPATAQRIVDWRAANGRFGGIAELMSVSGIGQKTFDTLKDLITV